MNVILCVVMLVMVLRVALWAFATLSEPLIGTGFVGLFFAMLLITIKTAIEDYTGKAPSEGEDKA